MASVRARTAPNGVSGQRATELLLLLLLALLLRCARMVLLLLALLPLGRHVAVRSGHCDRNHTLDGAEAEVVEALDSDEVRADEVRVRRVGDRVAGEVLCGHTMLRLVGDELLDVGALVVRPGVVALHGDRLRLAAGRPRPRG